jgi:hypothetical protein
MQNLSAGADLQARGIASTTHGTPTNGGTPCFATYSLLWQRSFWLPPALFPTTPLLVAAVEEAEAEDFTEAACAPAASTVVACALAISGAAPFTPGVFTADAVIA